MTVGTRLFWAVVALLALASITFAAGVPEQRQRGRAAADARPPVAP